MRLTLTPLAEQDLGAIGDYIATDNPSRAVSFIRELRTQCQRIAANPPARLPAAAGTGRRHPLLRPRQLRDLLCGHANGLVKLHRSPDTRAVRPEALATEFLVVLD